MVSNISRQDYLRLLSKAYNSLTVDDSDIIKNIILNVAKDVEANKDLTRCALDLTCEFSRKIFCHQSIGKCNLILMLKSFMTFL